MIRISNDISTALTALDRQVQLAKNTASLAVVNDKKDKPNATDSAAEAGDDVVADAAEVEESDSAVGNNLDVEA